MTEYVVCPKCKKRVLNEACVRQGTVGGMHSVEVGFKCPKCRHEWGFDTFKEGVKKKLKRVV